MAKTKELKAFEELAAKATEAVKAAADEVATTWRDYEALRKEAGEAFDELARLADLKPLLAAKELLKERRELMRWEKKGVDTPFGVADIHVRSAYSVKLVYWPDRQWHLLSGEGGIPAGKPIEKSFFLSDLETFKDQWPLMAEAAEKMLRIRDIDSELVDLVEPVLVSLKLTAEEVRAATTEMAEPAPADEPETAS